MSAPPFNETSLDTPPCSTACAANARIVVATGESDVCVAFKNLPQASSAATGDWSATDAAEDRLLGVQYKSVRVTASTVGQADTPILAESFAQAAAKAAAGAAAKAAADVFDVEKFSADEKQLICGQRSDRNNERSEDGVWLS